MDNSPNAPPNPGPILLREQNIASDLTNSLEQFQSNNISPRMDADSKTLPTVTPEHRKDMSRKGTNKDLGGIM